MRGRRRGKRVYECVCGSWDNEASRETRIVSMDFALFYFILLGRGNVPQRKVYGRENYIVNR